MVAFLYWVISIILVAFSAISPQIVSVDGIDITVVQPYQVVQWYKYSTEIDNTPYGEDKCLDFAIRSYEEWQEKYGNAGLHIVSSHGSYHIFNGTLLGGDPYELASWAFYEPQSGEQITVGDYPYEFPILITLITEIQGRGHSPYKLIEFVSANENGILVKKDMAGNRLDEKKEKGGD